MDTETLIKKLAATTAPPSVVNGVHDIIRNEQALQKQCDEYAADLAESQTAVIALRAENERLAATIEAATGECIVDLPAPDTDNARLLLANKAMARENERLADLLASANETTQQLAQFNVATLAELTRVVSHLRAVLEENTGAIAEADLWLWKYDKGAES